LSTAAESTEEKKSREELLLSVRLNLSLVALKTNEMKTAVEQCTKALELDENNEKALFRRGQALLAMHEPEKAVEDFAKVTALNSENKAALNQIALCKKKIAEFRQKDKMIFKKMFELYSAGDEVSGDWRRRLVANHARRTQSNIVLSLMYSLHDPTRCSVHISLVCS
jgi:FK506-binding protein 4/5